MNRVFSPWAPQHLVVAIGSLVFSCDPGSAESPKSDQGVLAVPQHLVVAVVAIVTPFSSSGAAASAAMECCEGLEDDPLGLDDLAVGEAEHHAEWAGGDIVGLEPTDIVGFGREESPSSVELYGVPGLGRDGAH